MLDCRVVAGLNLDGPIYGAVGQKGIDQKPFVLVANGGEKVTDWTNFYHEKLNGQKMDLAVNKTEHYAFTDIPLLLTVFEVPSESKPAIEEVFGTLDGRQVEKAVNDITRGLLELAFRNTTQYLEKVGRNPDISVIENDLGRHN